MKQQIIVSGIGGQGALTVTRLLAEAAAAMGQPVITSETHGMAQRGGAVISMIKVGPFRGPLIPAGEADVGLFLHLQNLPVHRHYLKAQAECLVNTPQAGDCRPVDATRLAISQGLPPVAANLILVGFGAALQLLFCPFDLLFEVLTDKLPGRFREINQQALMAGREAAGSA